MPEITLEVLAERIKNLTAVVTGLKEQLNPKTEAWNNAVNDVEWLKRFFWLFAAATISSWIGILGMAAKVFIFK